MTTPRLRIPKSYYLMLASTFIIAALYLNSLQYFHHFYLNWVNSELLINYSGGFVRRGLLGQTALLTREYFGVPPNRFFFFLFSILYLAQMFCFLWLSSLVKRKTVLLLLVLSPALLLFPAYDPDAFGRKDAFITLGLLLHAILVVKAHISNSLDKHYTTLFLLLIFPFILATMLIHEAQIFFLMHHAILTLLAPSARNKQLVLPAYFLVLAAIPAVILNPGDIATALSICNSWNLSEAYCGGGIEALTWNMEKSIDLSMMIFRSPDSIFWWGLAFLLSAIPLIAGFRERNAHTTAIFMGRVSKPLLASAGILPLILFFIGWDFGRWIHLYFIGIFSILMPFLIGTRNMREPDTTHNRMYPVIYWIMVFVYITSWRLPHCCQINSLSGGFFQHISAKFPR